MLDPVEIYIKKKAWGHDSSDRVPVWQSQGPKFKPKYCQKKKKKRKKEHIGDKTVLEQQQQRKYLGTEVFCFLALAAFG
jgi:hypothetical protein